jgi:hypothetical protein
VPGLCVNGNGHLVSKFVVMLEKQAAPTGNWLTMFRGNAIV